MCTENFRHCCETTSTTAAATYWFAARRPIRSPLRTLSTMPTRTIFTMYLTTRSNDNCTWPSLRLSSDNTHYLLLIYYCYWLGVYVQGEGKKVIVPKTGRRSVCACIRTLQCARARVCVFVCYRHWFFDFANVGARVNGRITGRDDGAPRQPTRFDSVAASTA